jgi:hypothetical protein
MAQLVKLVRQAKLVRQEQRVKLVLAARQVLKGPLAKRVPQEQKDVKENRV